MKELSDASIVLYAMGVFTYMLAGVCLFIGGTLRYKRVFSWGMGFFISGVVFILLAGGFGNGCSITAVAIVIVAVLIAMRNKIFPTSTTTTSTAPATPVAATRTPTPATPTATPATPVAPIASPAPTTVATPATNRWTVCFRIIFVLWVLFTILLVLGSFGYVFSGSDLIDPLAKALGMHLVSSSIGQITLGYKILLVVDLIIGIFLTQKV